VFATSFTLRGYLYSALNVTKDEQANLDQVKDVTRKAAGLSIQTPLFGAFLERHLPTVLDQTGAASLLQDARLTRDAHGGNTLLVSKYISLPVRGIPF